MACISATCQSGCYKDTNEEEEQERQTVADDKKQPNGAQPVGNSSEHPDKLCIKCKLNQTIAVGGSGGDSVKYCTDCFRSNLFGKFRFSVTSNAMILPSDKVLVAFSGGPCSRVALQFVHEMQHKALKNFDASRDRSLPVFGVGVAFIDESSIHSVPRNEYDKAIEEMRLVVSNLEPPTKEFCVAPIASLYSLNSIDGMDKLKELLNAVSDDTGKEDLLVNLRMLSLQKIALENGYTKLVLGSCTSWIARHVIAATVKGKGYSLAADIQYFDARWEIPVVLPLHDCLVQEVNLLCSLDSLKTVEMFNGFRSGINGLVSSFVKLLQEENPSRESTIARTAGKLTPFHFNEIPEIEDSDFPSASRRRQRKYNMKPNKSLPTESFCPICYSPFNKSDLHGLSSLKDGQKSSEGLSTSCCLSCQFQILPKEATSIKQFFSLLPNPIIEHAGDGTYGNLRWLREQIQDCLVSDSEDGT